LRTAVQIEELPSMSRIERARKVIARVRPLIAEAQGTLVPEEIPARMRELAEWPPSGPATAPASAEAKTDAPPGITS
jgi:hypothetical protein